MSALATSARDAHALILHSTLKAGFCAGADLRELYHGFARNGEESGARRRPRISGAHSHVMNTLDAAPLTTIAAVHGVTFGGGFELALICDMIIADKMARFCFPELRLGLIPGFGGIPRLKRDLGNARGSRSAAHRPQLQRHQSAADRSGQSGGRQKANRCEPPADRRATGASSTAGQPSPRRNSSSRFHTTSCGRRSKLFCDLYARPAVQKPD